MLLVVVLAVAGLASAQFTAGATPPTPGYGSGQLASPAPMTCRWTSGTQLRLDWQNTSPTFTTGYDVRRSTTSGSGYTTIGTTSPATAVTYTDTPSPVTTVRYYVTARRAPLDERRLERAREQRMHRRAEPRRRDDDRLLG